MRTFYWAFFLLTSIAFVLFSFLLIRLVEPLPFKDVLHLTFHPIDAGLFAGAAFTLVVSAVVGFLVAVGYISEIRYDFSQFGDLQQLGAVKQRVLIDCLKQQSFIVPILAAGFQEAYISLKPPIGQISYLRSAIEVLYLLIAASFFMAAIKRRRVAVFSVVLLAGLVATAANVLAAAAFLGWEEKNSGCLEQQVDAALSRTGESISKEYAHRRETDLNGVKAFHDVWELSEQAEGRTLISTYRFKKSVDPAGYHDLLTAYEKGLFEGRCSNKFLTTLKALETHTFYSPNGERLTSFAISSANCSRWKAPRVPTVRGSIWFRLSCTPLTAQN